MKIHSEGLLHGGMSDAKPGSACCVKAIGSYHRRVCSASVQLLVAAMHFAHISLLVRGV